MKSVLLSLLLLIGFITTSVAQLSNPVKWNYSVTKVDDVTYDVKITAKLDKGWHLYSQDAGDGPEPTSFTFLNNPMLKLSGKVSEIGKLRKEYDPNFDTELKFYDNEVTFVQRVVVKNNKVSTVLKGKVTFMVCNDKKCLPPKDEPFSIKIQTK
jgi:thiol:disulfide interchange protein DsbD